MNKFVVLLVVFVLLFVVVVQFVLLVSYYSYVGYDDVFFGGVKMILIIILFGKFWVWIKCVGNNLKLVVLLLYGGLGMMYEYFEVFDSYLFVVGIEYIYYDQFGLVYLDQFKGLGIDVLWIIDCFVEEVEQVCQVLYLDKNNFCLFGYFWGGILVMEYVLKYQQYFKCLVIFNMVDLILQYNEYVKYVFELVMDFKQLVEVKVMEVEYCIDDLCYMQIFIIMYYEKYVLCMLQVQWFELVMCVFGYVNSYIYMLMQGFSELGVSGVLEYWDCSKDLYKIIVFMLVIVGQYDIMDFDYMVQMVKKLFKGQLLLCFKGSYMLMYDDQQIYFVGLVKFFDVVEVR